MIDWANNLFSDLEGLIRTGTALVAIAIIVITAIKSKGAIAATLVSIIFAALLLWAVTADGVGWFKDGIKQETNGMGSTSVVFEQSGF